MDLTLKIEESGQLSFFQIPKFLMTNPKFKKMSCEAKFIYGLMLDRLKLSIKNKWVDKDNKIFIIFQNRDIAKMVGCGIKKVINLVKELKEFGLIETKRVGLTKPNMIYVKQFFEDKKVKKVNEKILEKSQQQENTNDNKSLKSSISNSFDKVKNISFSKSNKSITNQKVDTCEKYMEIIKKNISYNDLLITHKSDIKKIDEIIEIMTEVLVSKNEYVKISQNEVPIDFVKDRINKIDYNHIDYILFSLSRTTSKIGNIKSYLLATIYNSVTTKDNYYTQLVKHDLYGGD